MSCRKDVQLSCISSVGEALVTQKNSVILQLLTKNPNLGKNLYSTLQVLIKEKRRCPMEEREPLEHYAAEQLVQTSTEICYCIERRTLDIQDIKDMTENLVRMLERILKLAPAVGAPFAVDIRKFIFLVQDVAEALQNELRDKICPISWSSIADVLTMRAQTVEVPERNTFNYVPKIHQISVIRLIGAGGFGSVYKAIYLPSATTVCIKLVPENKLPAIQFAAADKLVASIINSPFLINYLCVFQAQGAYVTMMEYVSAVDLNRILNFSHVLPIDTLRYAVLQTFLGIEHLHLKGFVHRDIKIHNVLIKSSGHVKVIDFDTNKLCLSHFVKDRTLSAFFKRTAKEFRDTEVAGTLHYMAPELFMSYPYGRALDLWSLGVMVYRLLIGRLPFRAKDEGELKEKVLHHKPDWTSPIHTSSEASDLGERLMRKNAAKRLGCETSYREIRVHPFFQEIDLENFHRERRLCEVPHIREAMNPDDPARGARSPQASRGAKSRVILELRHVRDAKVSSMKPILTFASPGFIRLVDHLRSLQNRHQPDPALCENRRLYGLGTLSSELNYEWDAHDPSNYGTLTAIESILGTKRFTKIPVRADQKLWFGGFSYKLDMREVYSNVHGPCGFVWSIRGRLSAKSGLVAGDIIYKVDNLKVSDGLSRIKSYLKTQKRVVVSVFSINAFRLTKQGVDVPVVFGRLGHKDLVVTREIKQTLSIVQAFEVFTMRVTRSKNRSLQVHMIAGVNDDLVVSFPTDEYLYVGDVLLSINGISVSSLLTPDDLIDVMRQVRTDEIMITVLPISPLRYPD